MKLARWILVNTLFMAALIAGVSGIAGAWYVTTFVIWWMFVTGMICAFSKQKIEVNTTYLPKWLDVSYDVVYTGILVWTGHLFYGTIYVIAVIAIHSAITRKESEKDSSDIRV